MLKRTLFSLAALALALLTPCAARATDDAVPAKRALEPFSPEVVRLLPSPFQDAQTRSAEYLLSVDADRLLSRFRKNAGLEPKAEPYGGWEAQSIAGHSLGHYLSGLSRTYDALRIDLYKERAEYIVSELAECQKAGGTGMLGCDENYAKVFEEISKGNIRSQGFDLNGLWVPWYAMHKVFAGLLDAYRCCDCAEALEVAKKFGDWGIETTKNLTYEQFQQMLRCEYGGMNEAYYNLYAATGDEKYLRQGDRFWDAAVLKALSEGRDELEGKHANTQIPKLIGLARRHEVAEDGETNANATANFFWDRVANHHSYSIGGNSSGEHFGHPDVISTRLTDTTCETCNSYNMLKLTQKLFLQTGDPKYLDFAERTLYNHILPSLRKRDTSDGKNSLYTYYVPMRSGAYKTYSDREDSWTCCHGTGMENHAKYNEYIYYRGEENGKPTLYVATLIPSWVEWKEKGIKLTIKGDVVYLVAKEDVELVVKFRVPNNCTSTEETEGAFWIAGTTWKKGINEIKCPFVAHAAVQPAPDKENLVSLFYGPWIYVATHGSRDAKIDRKFGAKIENKDGAQPESDLVDYFVGSVDKLLKQMPDRPFFQTPPEVKIRAHHLELPVIYKPFYDVFEERYSAYIAVFTPEEFWKEKNAYQEMRKREAAIAENTIHFFQPGEMQPERDAEFAGEKSFNGTHMGRKWRDARDGGWMEFAMKVDRYNECVLVITYWGDETGNRVFDILVDGKKVAEKKLDRDKPGKFFEEVYPIPNPDHNEKVRVRIQAHPGATAGGFFGARTIRKDFEKEYFAE